MSEVISDAEDRRLINLSQNIRERIMTKMLEGGLPEGPENRDFLLKAMDGSDRLILNKAKIKTDAAAAQNQAQVASIVSNALLRFNPNRIQSVRTTTLELGNVEFTPVPGETLEGVEAVPYKEIMKD